MNVDFTDKLSWQGDIQIAICDEQLGLVSIERFHNQIMQAGKNLLRDVLIGAVVSGQIFYVALGNGTAAVADTQTKLANELFRKPVTLQQPGTTGQGSTLVYVAPYEANFSIEEIGWFAGPSATADANTGTMIARVLWHKDKNGQMSLQISRTDTLG